MDDLRDKVRDGQGAFDKLLGVLPGFKGYKEREIRRTADKLLRDHLVTILGGARRSLEQLRGRLADAGDLRRLGEVDTAGRRLEHLTDRVRYADYGYSGFFDALKIDSHALDRLYDFDLALLGGASRLADLAGQASAPDDQGGVLYAFAGELEALHRALDSRDDTARGIV